MPSKHVWAKQPSLGIQTVFYTYKTCYAYKKCFYLQFTINIFQIYFLISVNEVIFFNDL